MNEHDNNCAIHVACERKENFNTTFLKACPRAAHLCFGKIRARSETHGGSPCPLLIRNHGRLGVERRSIPVAVDAGVGRRGAMMMVFAVSLPLGCDGDR